MRIYFLQEFFWSYPYLEPLYQAARSYLEIGTRIDLLNARVEVRFSFTFVSRCQLANHHPAPGLARHAYFVEGECQQHPRRALGNNCYLADRSRDHLGNHDYPG